MEPLEQLVSPSGFYALPKEPSSRSEPPSAIRAQLCPCFASLLALRFLFTHRPPAAALILQKSSSALLSER